MNLTYKTLYLTVGETLDHKALNTYKQTEVEGGLWAHYYRDDDGVEICVLTNSDDVVLEEYETGE